MRVSQTVERSASRVSAASWAAEFLFELSRLAYKFSRKHAPGYDPVGWQHGHHPVPDAKGSGVTCFYCGTDLPSAVKCTGPR